MSTTSYDSDELANAYIEWNNIRKPFLYQPTFAYMTNLTGAKVVDFGCGSGTFLKECLKKGTAYCLGLDLSETMIKKALEDPENQLSVKEGKLELQVADCLKPQSESVGIFDYAVSQFIVHYCENEQMLEICYGNMFRALKPGGKVILTVAADQNTRDQQEAMIDLFRTKPPLKSESNGKDPYFASAQLLFPIRYVHEGKVGPRDVMCNLDTYYWSKEKLMKKLMEVGFKNVHLIDTANLKVEEGIKVYVHNLHELCYFIAGEKSE